jgi:hypothetical protein
LVLLSALKARTSNSRALASFKTLGFSDGICAKTALPVPAASHGVDLDAYGGREGIAWLRSQRRIPVVVTWCGNRLVMILMFKLD